MTTAAVDASAAEIRRQIFLSDDGVILCCTLSALDALDLLEPSLAGVDSLGDLAPHVTRSGFGYLRAGLRSLAGQGWLETDLTLEPATTRLRWTDTGQAAMASRRHYVSLGRFIAGFSSNAADLWSRPWDEAREREFLELLEPCLERWGLAEDLSADARATISTHLDAGLLVPAMLRLHDLGRLGGDAPALSGGELDDGIGSLLRVLGWLGVDGQWSKVGCYARDYAVHFTMVGCYLPMLTRLTDLYRGEVIVAPGGDADEEWHVNREMNLSASATAHTRYFADVDEIFVEIFDREPLADQPRFLADMGCGNGSWLIHLHRLIRERTRRGRHLDRHPLLLVGIDYNAAVLERAEIELRAAGVPGLLLHGDVGDPDALRSALAEHGLEIEHGLHIRAFIDHNRIYTGTDLDGLSGKGRSSGAYVDRLGHPLAAADVERDLVAHMSRWAPHVRRHGLVVLEAHCVAPEVAQRHLGHLHNLAFDAYHSYSHQYPVEYRSFVDCCRKAGLETDARWEHHYPSSRPFVAVSINRLLTQPEQLRLPSSGGVGAREDTWTPSPDQDLEDGEGLHRLLFSEGDLRWPRRWCSVPTGIAVRAALESVERRLDTAREGDVIRVLDYGTGTGLAAIELLKACQQRGVEERLRESGARLELHLVDLPSAWFAKGYELLSGCDWTRFHSLRHPDGGFRPLDEVLGGREMDIIIASMVFHLIPAAALDRVAEDLATVLRPGGRLLWNSPDLGPATSCAVLIHDPNRALRDRWLERGGADRLSPAERHRAQERADRRVLAEANTAESVAFALGKHLTGETQTGTYEMTCEEILEALLIPSNQREYLPELVDRAEREGTIRELMLEEVLPSMQESPAGTSLGLNIQWTSGDFSKFPAAPGER